MKLKKFDSQSGISLVEVLIVLVILAILVTFAIANFGSAKTSFQRQRIARELKVYLERARFDSVKRRAAAESEMARVIFNSPTSFTAVTDLNQNGKVLNSDGTIEDGDKRPVDFTQRSDTQIFVSDTFNYPVTIRFNQRGHITATDNSGNNVSPILFTICSKNCSDTSENNKELSVVSVSTTGTIAVLKNGQNLSTLPTPAITSSTPLFNCYVLVGNFNSSQCVNN